MKKETIKQKNKRKILKMIVRLPRCISIPLLYIAEGMSLFLKMVRGEWLVMPGRSNPKYKYTDLAPADCLENNEEYVSALDWAFSNPHIHNIALAGPYGSGKSSIIHSYIKRHSELKYISLSLANFSCAEKGGGGSGSAAGYDEEALETAIVKQLFYKVRHKRIPRSRYRKLQTIRFIKVVVSVIFLALLAGLCSVFLTPNVRSTFDTAVKNAAGNLNMAEHKARCLGVLVLFCLTWLVSRSIWLLLSRIHLKKISLAGKGEAEIDKAEADSVFNRNLDEIVYFFEATKYNAVFIEDLDRFESPEIFVRLRELNTILNGYEAIRKRIVFVYAVRDDIFSNKDRTKFFDFILPVIPVMSAVNSGDILLERIEKDNMTERRISLSEEYVNLIAPFIDDMRILNNIYNEFIVYKVTLQEETYLELSDQTMFSMIVFKNMHPKDFADLQAGRGIIKEAFERKQIFIREKRESLKAERQALAGRIEAADTDALRALSEVKTVMLFYMAGEAGSFISFQTNEKKFDVNEIMDDEFDVKELRAEGEVSYQPADGGLKRVRNFDGRSDFTGPRDYIKRCRNILLSIPEHRREVQSQIEDTDILINRLDRMTLKELLQTERPEDVFPEHICGHKLAVFLLRNGLLDETYQNYMTYFYPHSISSVEMNFILSVRNHEALSFTHPLWECERVIKRLLPYEFEQKEIYNFDLMEYFMNPLIIYGDESRRDEKFQALFRQLSDGSGKSWEFIDGFWGHSQNRDTFTAVLCEYWHGFWDFIYQNPSISKEKKESYFVCICNHVSPEIIKGLNAHGSIKGYFEEHGNDMLMKLYSVSAKRTKAIIEECGVCFADLDIRNTEEELVEWIFENGHYQITMPILQGIFEWREFDDMDAVLKSNYTAVLRLGYGPLSERIDTEFDAYVRDIVLGNEENTKESLDAVLQIIEKTRSTQHILQVIRKEDVVLDSLDRCRPWRYSEDQETLREIWDTWMDCSKLTPSWENLLLYGQCFGVTKPFASFLEQHTETLLAQPFPPEWQPSLTEGILTSDLEDACFEAYIRAAPGIEPSVSIEQIPQGHMRILLEHQYMDFSREMADELRTFYPRLYPLALAVNKERVMEHPGEYTAGMNDLDALVEYDKLDDSEKVFFIEKYASREYTKTVASFLCKTRACISKTAFRWAWDALGEADRYELFLNQITIFTLYELAEYLRQLGPEYQELADRSRRHEERLCDTEYNRELVENLAKIGYISSYRTEDFGDTDEEAQKDENRRVLVCRIRKES